MNIQDDCLSTIHTPLDFVSEADEIKRLQNEYADVDLTGIIGECTFRTKPFRRPDEGILIHSLSDLFSQVSQIQASNQKVLISCSYFEIYND